MKFLIPILIASSVCAQTCSSVAYGETSGANSVLDYYQSQSGHSSSDPLVVVLGNDAFDGTSTARACTDGGKCTIFDWLVNGRYQGRYANLISVTTPGATASHLWPWPYRGLRAAIGYAVHFANTLNNSCTINWDGKHVMLWGYAFQGSNAQWANWSTQSTFVDGCTYCDTGYVITAAVSLQGFGNPGDAYNCGTSGGTCSTNVSSGFQTSIVNFLGCTPSNPSTCLSTTAAAATAYSNITATKPGLMTILTGTSTSGSVSVIGVPNSIQNAIVTNVLGSYPIVQFRYSSLGHLDEGTTDTCSAPSCTISPQPVTYYQSASHCGVAGAPCGPAGLIWYTMFAALFGYSQKGVGGVGFGGGGVF